MCYSFCCFYFILFFTYLRGDDIFLMIKQAKQILLNMLKTTQNTEHSNTLAIHNTLVLPFHAVSVLPNSKMVIVNESTWKGLNLKPFSKQPKSLIAIGCTNLICSILTYFTYSFCLFSLSFFFSLPTQFFILFVIMQLHDYGFMSLRKLSLCWIR